MIQNRLRNLGSSSQDSNDSASGKREPISLTIASELPKTACNQMRVKLKSIQLANQLRKDSSHNSSSRKLLDVSKLKIQTIQTTKSNNQRIKMNTFNFQRVPNNHNQEIYVPQPLHENQLLQQNINQMSGAPCSPDSAGKGKLQRFISASNSNSISKSKLATYVEFNNSSLDQIPRNNNLSQTYSSLKDCEVK